MLKLLNMNLEKNTPPSNEPENPGRRGFLGKMIGAAALGTITVINSNKYMKQESEINNLYLSFKGKEGDIHKVNEATTLLIEEMNKENVNQVKITGTGHPNERIDILRDFLTKHLNSKIGNKNPIKNKIFSSGVYTRDNLVEILSTTTAK